MPDLSICIPTHNPDTAYLQELFVSIEEIGEICLEVVISDDSSSNAAEIETLLAGVSFPWRAWWSVSPLGMSSNWNSALDRARGEFAVLPGQDDLLSGPGIVHAVALAKRDGADVVFGQQRFVDAEGVERPNPMSSAWGESKMRSSDETVPSETIIRMALLHGNVLGDPCSVVFRTDAVRAVGGFSLSYEHAVDLELWTRLAASQATVARSSETIGRHRVHSVAATQTHIRTGAAQRDRARLLEDYGAVLGEDDRNSAIARLHSHRLFDVLRRGTRLEPVPAMEGPVWSRARAILNDVWQNLVGRIRRLHERGR